MDVVRLNPDFSGDLATSGSNLLGDGDPGCPEGVTLSDGDTIGWTFVPGVGMMCDTGCGGGWEMCFEGSA